MSAIISTQTLHQKKESVATCGMEMVEKIQDIYKTGFKYCCSQHIALQLINTTFFLPNQFSK